MIEIAGRRFYFEGESLRPGEPFLTFRYSGEEVLIDEGGRYTWRYPSEPESAGKTRELRNYLTERMERRRLEQSEDEEE